jgi:hypothetical protein
MTPTEVAAVAASLVAGAGLVVRWIGERGRDKAITLRAQVGVDLDVVAVLRGLLDEQRLVHEQSETLWESKLADCLEDLRRVGNTRPPRTDG